MDVSMLTVALLACPLVFSLIMAALPKTTSYSVFAGLNTISVAATLVLSVVTAGTMLSSGQNIDALGLWLHLECDPALCPSVAKARHSPARFRYLIYGDPPGIE